MADLNFALEPSTYTLYNALLWGNFKGHCAKIVQGKWGHRVVHLFISIIEFTPIVSQIASLFEMVIVRSCLFRVRKQHRHRVKEILTKTDEGVKEKRETILTPKASDSPKKEVSKNPPIELPNITPDQLKSLTGTHTPSPTSSNSDMPSSDSETPVSVPITASMQLERGRLERQNQQCLIT